MDQAPDLVGKVQGVVHGGEVLCLRELGGWQRVVGQVAMEGRGRDLPSGIDGGLMLRRCFAGAGGAGAEKQDQQKHRESKAHGGEGVPSVGEGKRKGKLDANSGRTLPPYCRQIFARAGTLRLWGWSRMWFG